MKDILCVGFVGLGFYLLTSAFVRKEKLQNTYRILSIEEANERLNNGCSEFVQVYGKAILPESDELQEKQANIISIERTYECVKYRSLLRPEFVLQSSNTNKLGSFNLTNNVSNVTVSTDNIHFRPKLDKDLAAKKLVSNHKKQAYFWNSAKLGNITSNQVLEPGKPVFIIGEICKDKDGFLHMRSPSDPFLPYEVNTDPNHCAQRGVVQSVLQLEFLAVAAGILALIISFGDCIRPVMPAGFLDRRVEYPPYKLKYRRMRSSDAVSIIFTVSRPNCKVYYEEAIQLLRDNAVLESDTLPTYVEERGNNVIVTFLYRLPPAPWIIPWKRIASVMLTSYAILAMISTMTDNQLCILSKK